MINKNELSKIWEVKKLSEIADKITDGTHHTPTYTETGIPFISVKDIRDQKVHFDNCKYISVAEHEELIKRCNPEEGDLLITKSGTIGRLAIVPKVDFSLFVSVALIKLQKNKGSINQKWMLYFFEFHIAFLDIKSKIKGGVVKNYHLEDLRQVEIPLPPLAEQERIVAKMEELFSELDAGLESLKTAQAQLKTYRQAVLKYAFEGKLTNDSVNEGELPNGWKWMMVKDVANTYGGYAFKSGEFKSNGKYQVIRMGNVRPGIVRLNESPVFLDEIEPTVLNRSLLNSNDVIITQTGTRKKRDYGFTALIQTPNLLLNQRLTSIRFHKFYLPKFFLYFSWTDRFKDQFFANETGNVGQGNVGMKAITETVIPLCSLEEQQRIVEEIESRLSVCDKLEETINASLKQAEALRQSILKQAFEGKLI